MNINELPPPPIKPTRLPSIVKDQDKEAKFAAVQTLGSAVSTHNPNAQPNKGGLLQNVSKYLEEQQKLNDSRRAQLTKQVMTSSKKLPSRKKKGSGWGVAIVIIWILFAVLGNLPDDTFDDLSSDPVSTPSLFDDTPDTIAPADVVFETQETRCLKIDIPTSSSFSNSGLNECEVSFDEGYSFANTAFVSFDGGFYYETPEEYLEVRSLKILSQAEINGVQYFNVSSTGFADTLTSQYVFWVRDLGILDDDGDLIETVNFYLYENDTNEGGANQIAAAILLSVEFISPQTETP